MSIDSFFSQPLFFLSWLFALLYALTVHEFSHALVARLLGDTTAEDEGRLTLNPIPHIDLLGFFMLLFVGFGWGKPVPVNEGRLRGGVWGSAIVSLAGPLSNIVSFIVFLFVFRFAAPIVASDNLLLSFLGSLIILNLILAVFNLIPIPPLDGSKLLFAALPREFMYVRLWLEHYGPFVLLGVLLIENFTTISILGRLFHPLLAWAQGFLLLP